MRFKEISFIPIPCNFVFAQLSQRLFRVYRVIIITCIIYLRVFFTVEAWVKNKLIASLDRTA